MTLLPIHILGGLLALVFGYIALAVRKGGATHRRAGMYFVYAMIVMSLSGAILGIIKFNRGNIVAGSLTFYFVLTGLLTVKRIPRARQIEIAAMIGAVALGLGALSAGVWLAQRGRFEAPPMFLFAFAAFGSAIGDFKMIRAGGIAGKPRLKRHLWRLCFAMWVAAASFFWGPKGRVPDIIYIPALLPIPVLTPVAVMMYWLWKMRGQRPARGIVTSQTTQTAEALS